MTQQLPLELKIEIIQHVDKQSLPVVLRVHSTFHEIGVSILYHTIVLRPFPLNSESLGTATKCLNAIIERPAAAGAVHCMRVDLFDWSPYTHHHPQWKIRPKEFFEAFRTALSKVVNLQKLELSNWGNTELSSVAQLPRGCRFSTLKEYHGPPEMLDNIQSSVLRTLSIRSLDGNIPTISSALLNAAQLSGQTLRALRVRCEIEDDDSESEEREGLYKDIPSLFPNLRCLVLESGHAVSFAFLDKLIANIVQLPDLRLLQISNWQETEHQDEESKVKHLHAGCPQLLAIILGYGYAAWRYSERVRTWIRQPKAEHGSDSQLWEEADYRKYLEDPVHEGFVYPSLTYGRPGG